MSISQQQSAWPNFTDFANAVQTSGAANKLPMFGGIESKTYSVYIDGKVADSLPASAREQEFKDITLHALTDKLGLDSESFRDTLRVGEVVAVREAWMQGTRAVMHDREKFSLLSEADKDAIDNDYRLLAAGLDHPWIQDQLLQQQQQSRNLNQMLLELPETDRKAAADRVPDEVTRGTIVSQTQDFTMQSNSSGELVTHENRRLGAIPELGKDVTVTYYRGSGQVFENVKDMTVGDPYIDKDTQDLAVKISDKEGQLKQVVLFNGVASFAKFAQEQQLPENMTEKAVEARIQTPKVIPPLDKPEREAVTGIYVDPKSQSLALDYTESGARNTILFGSALAVEKNAKAFDIQPTQIAQAYALEESQKGKPVVRTMEADQVVTVGPGAKMDQARQFAEKNFADNPKGKEDFLKRIEGQLNGEKGQKKDTSKDDLER